MSEGQAHAFVERMKTDEAFRERILAIEDPAARLAYVHSEGFDCTAEEIAAEGNRVSPEELDAVAAGGSCDLCDPWIAGYVSPCPCRYGVSGEGVVR